MLTTIIVFIVILGVLVFVHELGHFMLAKLNGVKVEEFAFGFRPRIFAKKFGDTVYALNLIPLGGYCKLYGEDYQSKAEGSLMSKGGFARFMILVGGALMNIILSWLILTILFITGFDPLFSGVGRNPIAMQGQTITILETSTDSPAQLSGIKAGDQVVSINGEKLVAGVDFLDVIALNKGKQITIELIGQQGVYQTKLTPRVNPPEGQGAVGVALENKGSLKTVKWYLAPVASIYEIGRIIGMSVVGFYDFLKNLFIHQKVSDEVTGLVGVGAMTGAARRMGFEYLMQLVMVVSAGLGVMNLMPILPLDGGHVAVLLLEKSRRKEMSDKVMNWLFMAGLGFVLLLFVIVAYKDIVRFGIINRLLNLF